MNPTRRPATRLLTSSLVLIAAFAARPVGSSAQIANSPPPRSARTHDMVPGERYAAGGFKSFLLGNEYRDLWTASVEAPVLDLDSVGGGLTPLRRGGYGQSISLHFQGKDGRRYIVRSIDKNPSAHLMPQLRGTFVQGIVQDQISALHPFGALAVDPLLEATGILHARHTLVVIPDDPRLGEYREAYAGMVGLLLERPDEGANNTPGFGGSTLINGSERFFERLEESPCDRIDAPAFLKARLVDMVIGDKDRHQGQWRWASFQQGECRSWQPIPEDRDQAFINFDGLMMSVARMMRPIQIGFGERYPSIVGLTFNGWEVDRQLLAELSLRTWDSVATVIQRELTDEVIDRAVRRLPPVAYRMTGERIATNLKARRDALHKAAAAYYSLISRQVDIYATDVSELAEIQHQPNGNVEVMIAEWDGQAPRAAVTPYFSRTFRPEETREIRVYLRGGADRAVVRGQEGRVTVHIIGGSGSDQLVNASRVGAGRTRFYDARGDNEFDRGVGAQVHEEKFERPPSKTDAHRYGLDWGSSRLTLPTAVFSSDLGVVVGGTTSLERYGFRKVPYSQRHMLRAGFATGAGAFLFSYSGRFRRVTRSLDAGVHLKWSGLDITRFHGFGNGTVLASGSSFFKVERQEFLAQPTLVVAPNSRFEVAVGPVLKISNTSLADNAERFIGTDSTLYGTGSFGQLGTQGSVTFDTRDAPGHSRRGVRIEIGGAVYPEFYDVESTFGEIHGQASTYLSADVPTEPTLALRVGGQKVWGTFPFHEAAYLGGGNNLRGFREQRFAGDASVYGNAELRLFVSKLRILVPGRFGVFGLGDIGRVFYDEDPHGADTWHTGVGGGIWMSFIKRRHTLSVAVASGDETTGLYVRAGFLF